MWDKFVCVGVEYDLTHLRPLNFDVVVPAKDDKPAQTYSLTVIFGHHCFTKGVPNEGEGYSSDLEFKHGAETRLFCPERHTLSASLPDIMRGVGTRKCFFTAHDSYFVLEGASLDGTAREYAIFFKVSKASKGGKLNVFVVSAYPIDGDETVGEGIPLKKARPIKFSVIAYNTKHNKPIKMPR